MSRWRRHARRWAEERKIRLLVALVAVLVLAAGFSPDARVYRTEFSPDLLELRSRRFALLGLVETSSSSWSSPVMDLLRGRAAPPTARGDVRWSYVHGHAPGVVGMRGPAKVVYRLAREDRWVALAEADPASWGPYLDELRGAIGREDHDAIAFLHIHVQSRADPVRALEAFRALRSPARAAR